jgi:hypothetical protein
MGAAPGVIHTGRFFVLIRCKWLEKLTGMKDKYFYIKLEVLSKRCINPW